MGPNQSIAKINSEFLAQELKRQGLKIWWLAEQIHVDRKTVSRWVNGKVKWIREENLLATAAILNCGPDELRAESDPLPYATAEERTQTAQLIHSEQLIAALTPSGKFDLAEQLIKALLSPLLPLPLLGNLSLELATCCWQQNKLQEAELYALHALDISDRADDPMLGLRAHQTLIIVYSKGGHLAKADEQIEIGLSHPLITLNPQVHARILFDKSNNLAHAGASIQAVCELRLQAAELFETSGTLTPVQSSTIWLGMSAFQMEAGHLQASETSLRKAQEFSQIAGYGRGLSFGLLLEAQLLSKLAYHTEAVRKFRDVYPQLQHGDTGMYEAIGAEILRRAGKFADAESMARQGLHSFNQVFCAHNHLELAAIYDETQQLSRRDHHAREALLLYQNAGAWGRARRVKEQQASYVPHVPARLYPIEASFAM